MADTAQLPNPLEVRLIEKYIEEASRQFLHFAREPLLPIEGLSGNIQTTLNDIHKAFVEKLAASCSHMNVAIYPNVARIGRRSTLLDGFISYPGKLQYLIRSDGKPLTSVGINGDIFSGCVELVNITASELTVFYSKKIWGEVTSLYSNQDWSDKLSDFLDTCGLAGDASNFLHSSTAAYLQAIYDLLAEANEPLFILSNLDVDDKRSIDFMQLRASDVAERKVMMTTRLSMGNLVKVIEAVTQTEAYRHHPNFVNAK